MLLLPISPSDALASVIDPALSQLPASMTSDPARVLMLAIALQESSLAARVQDGGPARGLWQFEQGGGVHGVMTHPATCAYARKLCAGHACPATERAAYLALAGDDVLAAGFARLLLFADPSPLPAVGDEDGAWRYYVTNWRPGHPRPLHWIGNYRLAKLAVYPVAVASDVQA